MPNYIPPFTWFKAFESAARHLNFTKAAQELNLTQSAVSQHVRALEESFGCTLFIRKHRGLELSDHGRRLLPSVSSAVTALTSAAATFDISSPKKILSVAVSSSISQWIIVPHLSSFTDLWGNVAVRLTTRTWADEFAGLDADLEIRFDTEKSSNQNSELLQPNNMIIVTSPELTEGRNGQDFTPSEICKFPLIQVLGTADTWQNWADKQNLKEELNICTYVESHGIALDFAKHGHAIAYTNSLIAGASLAEGSLIKLGNTSVKTKEGYYLDIKNGPNKDIAVEFANLLKQIVLSYS